MELVAGVDILFTTYESVAHSYSRDCFIMAAEIESLETLLDKASTALDERETSEIKRILYGTHAK